MIDTQGYRANAGMIVVNSLGHVLWARRRGRLDAWQFPQGGMDEGETPEQAMYRELHEELGLKPEHVKVLAESQHWYSYELPERYIRHHVKPVCIGQKQRWFLLELTADDSAIDFSQQEPPEFIAFQWVDYWYPLQQVVAFKRDVYKQALNEFASVLGREDQV